jgi:acetyl-CoA C-acetyltransferase
MPKSVYVIGAGRTDFARNFRKEGKSIRDIIVEAGTGAIADAGVQPRDVQSGVVGNFASGLFTRQLHLGSLVTEIDESLLGIPTMHVEAACASGGVAVLSAAHQIMSGAHDVVLVVGAEQQKTMSPADGSDVLGAAADYHAERSIYGEFMFPKLFARIADIYMKRYGLTERQLAQVAVKNYANAKRNPQAQTRNIDLTLDQACVESQANPRIAPPLKISDCSQITDGGASIVLCSQEFLRRLARPKPAVRLLGYGHTTDHLPLDRKAIPEFPIARAAARQAYEMAGLSPRDLDAAEVHDCFSISEIVAYEILGFAEQGQGATFLEKGIPVNAGGGLIGDGHPVGATGVRQVVEAYAHLTESAGARQVGGARRYLTFNMGGSVTTSVVMIWGAECARPPTAPAVPSGSSPPSRSATATTAPSTRSTSS